MLETLKETLKKPFNQLYINMENFVSQYKDMFDSIEKTLIEIPDKLKPILESVGGSGYKWLKSWILLKLLNLSR